jgi:hypothetical protein
MYIGIPLEIEIFELKVQILLSKKTGIAGTR